MPPYRFSKTIFSDLSGKLITALRAARLEAGLTQVDAAAKLGCRQTFLSKIECGERRIDIVEFVILCGAYGIAPGKLLDSLMLPSAPGKRRSPRRHSGRTKRK